MPSVYVFTGPSLSAADAHDILGVDACCLPPAAQGDVYRAARARPTAIGIIDGYFDTLPAIWHKEILWAIHEGVAVFGASSMGALRAAELAAFGMRGVGEIFEAFRSGALEDDDEVTLVHEPEATGFRALSVPMVDLRATLKSALAAGVLGERAHDTVVDRMKRLFYPERSYRRLLAEGHAAGLGGEMEALEAWLPAGRVDAKRLDALAMLRAIREHLATVAAKGGDPAPAGHGGARFSFEHTTYWDALRRCCDASPSAEGALGGGTEGRALLDEVRLRGGFELLRARAVKRALARAHAAREGQGVESERLARAASDFRRERGLGDAASFQAWLASRDLDEEGLARLLEGDAAEGWAMSEAEIERHALDEVKLDDAYPGLRDRARAKTSALTAAGEGEPGVAAAGITKEALVDWYFREVARTPAPAEMSAYARRRGFEDDAAFVRAIVREYVYRRVAERSATGE